MHSGQKVLVKRIPEVTARAEPTFAPVWACILHGRGWHGLCIGVRRVSHGTGRANRKVGAMLAFLLRAHLPVPLWDGILIANRMFIRATRAIPYMRSGSGSHRP